MKSNLYFSYLIIFILSCHSLSYAQIQIQGTIEGYNNNSVFLASLYGDFEQIVDSTKTNDKGTFLLQAPKMEGSAMYQIVFGDKIVLEMIVDQTNIEFETKYFDPAQKIYFSNSLENTILYKYKNLVNQANFKLQFLTPILKYYPQNNQFYDDTRDEYINIYSMLNKDINQILTENQNLWVYDYIKSDRPTIINRTLPYEEQTNAIREHFLDSVDFSNPKLLHSDLFSKKIIQYLDYYRGNAINPKYIEMDFTTAIDNILKDAEKNDLVYKFTYDYLVNGLNNNQLSQLVNYIKKNYPAPKAILTDNTNKAKLDQRIQMGAIAPDFSLNDIHSKPIKLSDIKSKYTLLIFWTPNENASTQLLDNIKKHFGSQYSEKNMLIIGIANTNDPETALDIIDHNKYSWINAIPDETQNTALKKNYEVFSTPKLVLLDRKKRIIAIPKDMKEISLYLDE